MKRTLLKSKIHRATVTEANLDYEGSVTIDADLMKAADIVEFERVEVYDITNGNRLATYAITGEGGSGTAVPERVGADALGPSQIFGDIGIAAAGFFGGGKVRFRGTSVAAPLVATEIVQSIGTGGFPGGRDYVQAQAAISEATLPARSAPSAALGGSGRYMTERMRNRAMPFEDSDP